MIITREMGERGQVVIPKNIRELLNLDKNSKVEFEVKGKEVILRRKTSGKSLQEFFNSPIRANKSLTAKEIKKLLEERYEIP